VPVEEIGIGILGAIARFIGWLFIEIFLQVICWCTGCGFLKVVSFGRYPSKDSNQGVVIAVGLIILLSPILVFTIYAI
jgi:hypothetical protein